eukprot:249407_1
MRSRWPCNMTSERIFKAPMTNSTMVSDSTFISTAGTAPVLIDEFSEDWDSDRTLSDAEMLHEHIHGAKRFRTIFGDNTNDDTPELTVSSDVQQSPVSNQQISETPQLQSRDISVISEIANTTDVLKRPASPVSISQNFEKRQKIPKFTDKCFKFPASCIYIVD